MAPSFKKPLEEKLHGDKWRSEVCDKNQQWKPLEEWKDQYEPPKKEDSERVKNFKANAADKAKTKVLKLMNEGISKKLVLLSLEVTSKLLTKAEGELKMKADSTSTVLPQLLNSLNAIILTFRFDKGGSNTRKFVYLRRVACTQWTDLLLASVSKAQSSATQLVTLQDEVCETIVMRQDDARVMASAILDDAMGMAKESSTAAVEETLTQLSVDTAAEVLIANGANVNELKQEVATQKDTIVDQFGAFLKNLVMGQMDQLTSALTQTLRRVFAELAVVLKKVDTKQAQVDEPHKEMYNVMEGVYSQLQDSVQSQVQMVVNMLEAMMSNDDEQEQE